MRYNMFGVNKAGGDFLCESDYLDVIESRFKEFALLGYDKAFIIDNVTISIVSSVCYGYVPKSDKILIKSYYRKEGYDG